MTQQLHSWELTSKKWNLCSYKPCTQVFITALFVISPSGKQHAYLSTDEWLNQLRYFHIMEHYTAMKRTKYWYMRKLWWISRKIDWMKKPIPKGYVLHDSIYVTFLKWQLFRNGEFSSFPDLGKVGVVAQEQHQTSLRGWNCSVSWQWWWKHEATHLIKVCRTAHTCTQMNTSKTGQAEWNHGLCTCQYPGCNIVLLHSEDVTIGGTGWKVGIQDFCVLFLPTACERTII